MILETLTELTISSISDRGIPNEEKMLIEVNQDTDMGKYCVLLGIDGGDGYIRPINDNLYWFGNGQVYKGDWIFLYTGQGEPRTTDIPNQLQKMYSLHWGRDFTLLNDVNIVPAIIRADGIRMPLHIKELPAP